MLGVRGPDVPVPSFLQSTLGTTTIPGIGFFLDAYATTADTDILSTPHILATDNTPAELHVQLNTSLQRNAPSYGVPAAGGAGSTAAVVGVRHVLGSRDGELREDRAARSRSRRTSTNRTRCAST